MQPPVYMHNGYMMIYPPVPPGSMHMYGMDNGASGTATYDTLHCWLMMLASVVLGVWCGLLHVVSFSWLSCCSANPTSPAACAHCKDNMLGARASCCDVACTYCTSTMHGAYDADCVEPKLQVSIVSYCMSAVAWSESLNDRTDSCRF